MHTPFRSVPQGAVGLLPGVYQQRAQVNRSYMVSLRSEALLQNFYLEAGLKQAVFRASSHGEPGSGDDWHWGWESPTCQLRGHFLGHWLSAAAMAYAATGDAELKGKADRIVAELARCQQENGGEWVFSIPPAYLDWVARGKPVWAPHYTIHKTLMGLNDMATLAGNAQAVDILEGAARWFDRWTAQFTRAELDDILDVETGGMLEAWADLYGITGKQAHLDLMARYDRPRLFDRLLRGEDPLTNRHANTTIPEAHGAARAYEVTGDARWRRIVEAYWRCAVTDRGTYATGSQTSGEIWTPPHAFAARLGDKNQEHCVVYNMIRLAEFLLRWTGDPIYADYIERNLYNGILAQQNARTGMIAYFLALEPGSRKRWGSPTNDFWCCHGTLVQAHARHDRLVYLEDDDGLALCQYIPSELRWRRGDAEVRVALALDTEASLPAPATPDGSTHRPDRWLIRLAVHCSKPAEFTLKLRLPSWINGPAEASVNGAPEAVSGATGGFHAIRRTWHDDAVTLSLPTGLWTSPIPDAPEKMAFMDGPVTLAGLCEHEIQLHGDPAHLLAPDDAREWIVWKPGYRTRGQEHNIRFLPLHAITDEAYTVYFPVVKP
jgi:hypothetical protein